MRVFIFTVLLSISMISTVLHAGDVPKQILAKIKANAAADHPNDNSAQEGVINLQVKAYHEARNYNDENVPIKVLKQIKRKAEQDYPYDFSAQEFGINLQVDSYSEAMN